MHTLYCAVCVWIMAVIDRIEGQSSNSSNSFNRTSRLFNRNRCSLIGLSNHLQFAVTGPFFVQAHQYHEKMMKSLTGSYNVSLSRQEIIRLHLSNIQYHYMTLLKVWFGMTDQYLLNIKVPGNCSLFCRLPGTMQTCRPIVKQQFVRHVLFAGKEQLKQNFRHKSNLLIDIMQLPCEHKIQFDDCYWPQFTQLFSNDLSAFIIPTFQVLMSEFLLSTLEDCCQNYWLGWLGNINYYLSWWPD